MTHDAIDVIVRLMESMEEKFYTNVIDGVAIKTKMNPTKKQLEIDEWLLAHNIINWIMMPDGTTVCVDADVQLSWSGDGRRPQPPFRFGVVRGSFKCGVTDISALDWLPHTVKGDFDCSITPVRNFSGIHKYVKTIDGVFNLPPKSNHVLGVLMIDGVTKICMDRGPIDAIFNKYVGTGDILSAQDELIDAGFVDEARL
jgi:hypothetical protein